MHIKIEFQNGKKNKIEIKNKNAYVEDKKGFYKVFLKLNSTNQRSSTQCTSTFLLVSFLYMLFIKKQSRLTDFHVYKNFFVIKTIYIFRKIFILFHLFFK